MLLLLLVLLVLRVYENVLSTLRLNEKVLIFSGFHLINSVKKEKQS
jgi:hypothetical protein